MTNVTMHKTIIVGQKYHAGAHDKLLSMPSSGARVDLVREPDSPHDANAIRCDADGVTLGYVPRDDAKAIAPLIDARGVAAAWLEGYNRLCVEIEDDTHDR